MISTFEMVENNSTVSLQFYFSVQELPIKLQPVYLTDCEFTLSIKQ